jgi:hypothetical protein
VAEESVHLRLSDGQKSRLLGLALDADRPLPPPDENEQRGDLLWDLLRCPLPAHEPPPDAGIPAASSSHSGLRSVFGPPIRELLLDPKTDVAALQRIKEYAKTLGRNAGSEVEKDAFMAIYFAAIAAAMAFHNERITEHSDQDLAQFLISYERVAWMPANLRELLTKAGERCGTGGRTNETSIG